MSNSFKSSGNSTDAKSLSADFGTKLRGQSSVPESDENKTRGRPQKGKARCLLERLEGHRDKVLAFMFDFRIPFDNNLAERDVRMAKLRQKISGTFRSPEMAKAFCRIRSFISTIRKHTFPTMETIEKIFTEPSNLSKIVAV